MTPIERFEALTKRQQDEILDKHRHYNTEHLDWWDAVYDDFKADMLATGIDVDKMYFSGFYSQGDGACFEGRVDDWPKFLESVGYTCPALTALAVESWKFRVEHRGHYYHENCTSFTSDMVSPDDYTDDVLGDFVDENSPYKTDIQNAAFVAILKGYDYDKLHEEFEQEFKSHMRDLYNRLEVEYDSLTSDESVLEALHANDMLDEIIDELENEYA
jgi:hypothetical protein